MAELQAYAPRPAWPGSKWFEQAVHPALLRFLVRPASALERRWVYASLSVLVVAVCGLVAIAGQPIAFPLDDAYITLHNAEVLLSGVDRNYAGTSALIGATSPIHLALVAALMRAMDPLAAGFVAGALALELYALGLARLAFQNGGSLGRAVVLVALGTLTGYAPYHLLNGLETGLAMAAIAWTIVFAGAAVPGPALPLICGVLPFIRPELAALSVVMLARQTWLRAKNGDGPARIASDFAVAALGAAPCAGWLLATVGTVIPPTAEAKTAFFAEAGLPAWDKMQMVIGGLLQAGIVPLLAFFLLPRRSSLSAALWVFMLAVPAALYLSLPGGMLHNWSRYAFVLLPVLAWAVFDRSGLPFIQPIRVLLCVVSVASGYHGISEYVRGTAWTRTEAAALADWVDANIPSGEPVLIHDAGYLAFATNARLVDAVGLKTPESVPYHQALTGPSGGRLRSHAVSEIARAAGTRYAIILNDDTHWWENLAAGLRQEGWTLTPLRAPRAPPGYVVYRLAGAD